MQKGIVQFAVGFTLFSIAATLSGFAYLITTGRSVNFCRHYIIRPLVRLALAVHGIRLEVDVDLWQQRPAFFMFNHHSNLDIFLIAALDLPPSRSFFSTEMPKHGPMMLAAHAIGAFLIAPQHRHNSRVQCFKRAETVLRHTGESIIASPEGARYIDREIGPFNKGVFHLALQLQYPIIPLLFEIPPEANAKMSYFFKPANVRIRALKTIETLNLDESDIAALRDGTRQVYQEAMASSGIQSKNSPSINVDDSRRRSPRPRFIASR